MKYISFIANCILLFVSVPFVAVSLLDYLKTKDHIDIVIFIVFIIPSILSSKYMITRWKKYAKNHKKASPSFHIFRPKSYDMDSLEGINAIPVPAKNYNTGDPTKDCIYYLLQRKATEHKKNQKMDLAIACLKKSNALSDYEQRPLLTQKEYLRVIKYLEYDKRFDEAKLESEKITKRHPEFNDKRISNLPQIKNTLQQAKKIKNDYVLVSTNNHCPICQKYNLKVYSISGKSKKYSKLPLEITKNGGFCPECYLSLTNYFDGINTPVK